MWYIYISLLSIPIYIYVKTLKEYWMVSIYYSDKILEVSLFIFWYGDIIEDINIIHLMELVEYTTLKKQNHNHWYYHDNKNIVFDDVCDCR